VFSCPKNTVRCKGLENDPEFTEKDNKPASSKFHGYLNSFKTFVKITKFNGLDPKAKDTLTAKVPFVFDGNIVHNKITFVETKKKSQLFRATFTIKGKPDTRETEWEVVKVMNTKGSGKGFYFPLTTRLKGLPFSENYIVDLKSKILDIEDDELSPDRSWYYLKGGSSSFAVITEDPEDSNLIIITYYNLNEQKLVKIKQTKMSLVESLKSRDEIEKALAKKQVKILKFNSVIFTDDSWTELLWHQVLSNNSNLKIKAQLSQSIPNLDILKKLNIPLKLKLTTFIDDLEMDIKINNDDVLHDNKEVRLTILKDEWKSIYPNYSSIDIVTSVELQGSTNFNDANKFDSMSVKSGGLPLLTARGIGNWSSVSVNDNLNRQIKPWTAKANKSFLNAGGSMRLEAIIGNKNDFTMIQYQANILYVSGHQGSNEFLQLGTSSNSKLFGPKDAKDWKKNLEIVIISGCSVLDIGNLNQNPDWPPEGIGDPGKKWAKTGPKIFLGYNYKAPSDTQGSVKVIETWYKLYSRGINPIDAWRQANASIGLFGVSACAIDTEKKRYYYLKKYAPLIYKWESYKY